jgi:hypothetical protein
MTAPQFADFLREALQVIGARYLLVPQSAVEHWRPYSAYIHAPFLREER